jgi:hypothetical protein
MLNVAFFIYCYAECHYAECLYAEFRYAECRYAEFRYAECRSECRGDKQSSLNTIRIHKFCGIKSFRRMGYTLNQFRSSQFHCKNNKFLMLKIRNFHHSQNFPR